MFKSPKQKLFIGLLGVFFIKQLFWVAIIPTTQAPDEYAHMSYVESWYYEEQTPRLGETLISKRIEEASQMTMSQEREGLTGSKSGPISNEQSATYQPGSQLNWIAQHPPFYYYILREIYPLVAKMGVNEGIFFLRISSVFLGLLTIVLTYLTIRKLRISAKNSGKDDYLPLIVAGFIAFLPDFSFISAVLNNDNMVLCLSAGLMYTIASLLVDFKGKLDRNLYENGGMAGVLIGALLITKATSLPIVTATILFEIYYFAFKRKLPWLDLVKFFFMQFAIVMPMSAWWYIYNYNQFHVLLPDIATVIQMHPDMLKQHAYLTTLFPEVTGIKNLITPYGFFIEKNFFWNYFVNIWGVFGAGFITLGVWQIIFYIGLIFAAVIGYFSPKGKKTLSDKSESTSINIYLILLVSILFGAITYKLFQIAQGRGFLGAMHGRYFLPAMIPIGYWIFLGIQRLFKNRQNHWVVALLFLFFILNEIATIVTVIMPSFY